MKIGNLSQALVRPPHIFINPNGKIDEINTFRIPKQSINKRYFRERINDGYTISHQIYDYDKVRC